VTGPLSVLGWSGRLERELTRSWETAFLANDKKGMKDSLTSLHQYMTTYLDSLGVDRMSLEKQGLGIRPLEALGDTSDRDKHQLSRRFYRLGQWTEILQGESWLTDDDSEVYRYYSLCYKLDDCWWVYQQ
jgi:FKBP12-rapamycin complex-associated protein